MSTPETPKSRLERFAATFGMSLSQFEKACGMARGVASRISEKSYAKTFYAIQQRFPILNIEWVKTGEGDMLMPDHPAITDGGAINASGGISHAAVNSGSGSASYSAGDQNLLRVLIRKIDKLSEQLEEKDAMIDRLAAMVEAFAGIEARFRTPKRREEEERRRRREAGTGEAAGKDGAK